MDTGTWVLIEEGVVLDCVGREKERNGTRAWDFVDLSGPRKSIMAWGFNTSSVLFRRVDYKFAQSRGMQRSSLRFLQHLGAQVACESLQELPVELASGSHWQVNMPQSIRIPKPVMIDNRRQ